jgi:hypothetical protein
MIAGVSYAFGCDWNEKAEGGSRTIVCNAPKATLVTLDNGATNC